MNQYGVLAVLVAILIGLATPAIAAPLTLADLDATTEAVVQLEDVGSGMWELSFIANTELIAVTVGIADEANVFNVNFLGQANNFWSFTGDWSGPREPRDLPSLVISAYSGTSPAFPFPDPIPQAGVITVPFAANTAHTIASFQYANEVPGFDNTGVEHAYGPFLLKPAPPILDGIDLARVEFRVVPEPSSWLLLSLGIAGMVMIRRKLASRA